MRFHCSRSRLHFSLRFAALLLCVVASIVLIVQHADAVFAMQRLGLPAAVRLQQMDERASVIRAQNEAAQLQAALRTGTEEEVLRIAVLPESFDSDRVLASLDALFSFMDDRSLLAEYPVVTVADPVVHSQARIPWTGHPLSFDVRATDEGMATLFSFVRMAGMLTVGDLFSPAEIDRLLLLSEQHNPASIVALEQFLSSDLLRFAEEPRPHLDRLYGSLTSPLFAQELSEYLHMPSRHAGLALLKELAPSLRATKLWPLRLLLVDSVSLDLSSDSWLRARVQLQAASRLRTLD